MSTNQGDFQNKNVKRDSKDDSWFVALHLSTFAGLMFPLGSVLGPLILWSMKKREIPEFDREGRQVLNFHITWTLVQFGIGIGIVVGYLMFLFMGLGLAAGGAAIDFSQDTIGAIKQLAPAGLGIMAVIVVFLFLGLGLFATLSYFYELIMALVNTFRASNGEPSDYPFRFQFFKEDEN